MIRVRSLVKKYGAQIALAGIDLSVETGELFSVIGPDGAGKSTLFRILAGLLRPTSGEVHIEPGATLGLVPQRFSLYEDLSIEENLNLRARLYGLPSEPSQRRAKDLLERVGLIRFTSRLAGQLSGGMKQKLALVSALLPAPRLLLLDEPTTGVDPLSRREFWLLLNGLHHEGITIVVSTPYMDEAEYATRLAFLDLGRIVARGTREEILATYDRPIVEIHSSERLKVRERLASVPEVDDLSLFGTELHARGRPGTGERFFAAVKKALEGLVEPENIRQVPPSLEDVFVLHSDDTGAAA